jgi:hypothetical protein
MSSRLKPLCSCRGRRGDDAAGTRRARTLRYALAIVVVTREHTMQAHRFDSLMRTLAAPGTRRRLLRGFVVTATTGLALRLSFGPVAAQVVNEDSGETCSQDSDCMPAEPDPCAGAVCDAGSCSYTSVACIPGYICCGNGECCAEGEADALPDVTSGDPAASGESDETPAEVTESSNSGCTISHSVD